jgi:prepilin-type N-terminal cleavage/methylation domain-containing protein
MHIRKAAQNKKGFTIIELVIVIGIIAIIAAFVYPKMSGRELPAKITSTETQTLRYYEAAKSYVTNHAQTDYTNATKANLLADNLVSSDANNAFGNTFTVGPKTGAVTVLEIKTNTDVATTATALADKLTAKGYTATASGTTVTANF